MGAFCFKHQRETTSGQTWSSVLPFFQEKRNGERNETETGPIKHSGPTHHPYQTASASSFERILDSSPLDVTNGT